MIKSEVEGTFPMVFFIFYIFYFLGGVVCLAPVTIPHVRDKKFLNPSNGGKKIKIQIGVCVFPS